MGFHCTCCTISCSGNLEKALNRADQEDEAERRRKEEADFKAKLAEIVEKQRRSERDLEEKERLRMAAALQGRPPRIVVPQRPGADPQGQGYVPRFRRGDDGGYYFVESEKGRLNIKL